MSGIQVTRVGAACMAGVMLNAATGGENVKIEAPYKRPSGATTKEQRKSVQCEKCVDCGVKAEKMVADHKTPLVKEYYQTGKINKKNMRDINSVQPQCPTCSAKQGAAMSKFSKQKKSELGFEK